MFTFVPVFQFFSALHRLLKGAMVANLHVPMAVAVNDRRQNVAAIQLSTPASYFDSFQTLLIKGGNIFSTCKTSTTQGETKDLPPATCSF